MSGDEIKPPLGLLCLADMHVFRRAGVECIAVVVPAVDMPHGEIVHQHPKRLKIGAGDGAKIQTPEVVHACVQQPHGEPVKGRKLI